MQQSSFCRDTVGRLTIDFAGIASEQYVPLCLEIADVFGLQADGIPIVGSEQMFWEFNLRVKRVHIDWDIWLDLIVSASTTDSKELAMEIAAWIETEIEKYSTDRWSHST